MSTSDTSSDAGSFKSTLSRSASPNQTHLPPSSHTKPSADLPDPTEPTTDLPDPTKLNPEEENHLKTRSLTHKSEANAQFAHADYTSALQTYDKALASLPTYLDYEIAVLRSNVAACQLKLQEWKEAEKAASEGLDCLERIDPSLRKKTEEERGRRDGRDGMSGGGAIEEVDDDTALAIETLEARTGHTHAEIQRIRVKLRLRRAKAREEMGGWHALEGANEDYTDLLGMGGVLSELDRRSVQRALATMPGRLEEARSKEMGEMMGKLKELGNGILKPFGLSTENFKFEQQEGGGYSMNFDQGAKR